MISQIVIPLALDRIFVAAVLGAAILFVLTALFLLLFGGRRPAHRCPICDSPPNVGGRRHAPGCPYRHTTPEVTP